MKIKNQFLASILTELGIAAKAELVIDDSNGVSLTFPDISDIAEIAEGVAVDAPDGTYVIADGEDTITVVVAAGLVTSFERATPEALASEPGELDAEVQAVLKGVVTAFKGLQAKFVALEADHKTLKASLKHEEEKPGAAAASTVEGKYKIVD